MILTCPACATQYRLKDGAIPPEGRQVRCAACKHKWHQDGAGALEAAPAEDDPTGQRTPSSVSAEPRPEDGGVAVGPPQPDPDHVEQAAASVPEAAAREQMIAANPEPETPARSDAAAPYAEPQSTVDQWVGADNVYSPGDQNFAAIPAMHDDDGERRSKIGWIGWIIGLIVVVVAAAAAFYFLAPAEMKARAGIVEVGESPLQITLTTSDRQKLASGNEMLSISGRVINASDREQAVPPIHAELRDPSNNRLVYEWTIPPPARSLAAGAAASFDSAEVDVPKGGESLSLRFAS